MRLIGVDVGGTFTDIIYCDTETGAVAVNKVSTTPGDPSQGVMAGLLALCAAEGIGPASIATVLHGTTTATNAVLEGKGARAGMVTNAGFRDVLHIGRHQRVEHYSIRQDLPWQSRPLIARRHRKTVRGRLVPPVGAELEPLDEEGVRTAAAELAAEGVDSVAVCFLFSYLDARHEDRAAAILREAMPGVFVTTSSAVSPQFREFERFTTAALAAFVGPVVRRYVERLAVALKGAGLTGELRIMASNGGVATAATVAEKPALTLLSGLAAGVLGGAAVGARAGRPRLITFDIGGTSADIGIVRDGVVTETDARSTAIAGFPLLMPMIDVHTIGAGGGSIAYRDRGGAFRVGPRSAGAVPGPVAYGRGGTEPTVTDANLVLGRLDAGDALAGGLRLDAEGARRAVSAFAASMGLGVEAAAAGILAVIDSNMANAVRSRTVQKGIDPRDFALVAFGGAGPLHGAAVAAMLDIPEVIVPPFPGLTSAMGLLTTDLRYDAVRTQFGTSGDVDLVRLTADLDALQAGLAEQFRADMIAPEAVSYDRSGDLRYVGQGYELRIPLPPGPLGPAEIDAVWSRFHAAHAAEYGHAFPDGAIEIVNVRVAGTGRTPKFVPPAPPIGGSLADATIRTGPCWFTVEGRLAPVPTPFYRRATLPAGVAFAGPAIVLQPDSTTVVPPGAAATVDEAGNLVITLPSTRLRP